jgi:prefoldin subunit 5
MPKLDQATIDFLNRNRPRGVNLGDIVGDVADSDLDDQAEDTSWGIVLAERVQALEERTSSFQDLAMSLAKAHEDIAPLKQGLSYLLASPAQNNSDTSWDVALANKVQALEDQVATIPMLVSKLGKAEETLASLMQAVTFFTDSFATKGEVTANSNALVGKIDALKTTVTALATKLDADAGVTDTNYATTVAATLL